MRLNARALGFASGVLWGTVVLIVTLMSIWAFGAYGKGFLRVLIGIYPGYSISIQGALLGLCYGFVDGFIFGWLIATLYNFFAKEE